MAKIIFVHSFRGGSGKSNLVANFAAVTAAEGKRVGIVDSDMQSPGIHVLFDLDEQTLKLTLNDYLWNRCNIAETAYWVTPDSVAQAGGSLFLVSSSIKVGEIARILDEGYSVVTLHKGLREICQKLRLDYLFVDTHSGLDKDTLLSIAISNALVIVLRPDRQDFQGTASMLQVMRSLDTPKPALVINKVPAKYDLEIAKQQIADKFGVPVVGALPVVEEMFELGSRNLFCLEYPTHPYTEEIKRTAQAIIGHDNPKMSNPC